MLSGKELLKMFTKRTTKPGKNDLCYTRRQNGGWSWCIQGYPTDPEANTLSNCVGMACGRFNEAYNEITGYKGMKYYALNCNAENFITRAAEAHGLKSVQTPVIGGIMVWEGKGSAAGHVEFVEDMPNLNTVFNSASNYGGTTFYNVTRNNNNGNWGLGSSYKYLGCIVNPAVGELRPEPKPEPKPEPTPSDKYNIGDTVVINGALYKSSDAAKPSGTVANKVTKITRKVAGAAHPYNTEGDLGWMNEADIKPYVAPKPETLKAGDKVVITGTGNGSSNGNSNTAYGIGWTREIIKVWEGRPYPYQVGLNGVTTGFYKADALRKA